MFMLGMERWFYIRKFIIVVYMCICIHTYAYIVYSERKPICSFQNKGKIIFIVIKNSEQTRNIRE